MLTSQANPINRRFFGNNIGNSYIPNLPQPNDFLGACKIKLRGQFKFETFLDLNDYSLDAVDFVSIYSDYSLSSFVGATVQGITLSALGTPYDNALGNEIIDPYTGLYVPQGQPVMIDFNNFTYDIYKVVWDSVAFPFFIQPSNVSPPWQKPFKGRNRSFHYFLSG